MKTKFSLDSLLQQLFSRLVDKQVKTNLTQHQTLPPRPLGSSETGAESSVASRLCLDRFSAFVPSSGVLVGQVKAVVVGSPEGGRPLVVQLSVDAARTRLSFLPTLGVEHSAASAAPAETPARQERGGDKPVSGTQWTGSSSA